MYLHDEGMNEMGQRHEQVTARRRNKRENKDYGWFRVNGVMLGLFKYGQKMIGDSRRRNGGKGACGIVSSFGLQRRRDLNPNECACSCYGTTAINMLKDMQSSRKNVSAAKKENFDSGRVFF